MRPRITVPVVAIGLVMASIGLAAPASATFPGKDGRIAFISDREGIENVYNLFTMQPDGTDVQQLTHFTDRAGLRPSWSPDGTQVVFEERNLANTWRQIYVINADGTGHHRVFADRFFRDFSPSYSPDGSQIVFQRCRPDFDACAIAVARSDGTGRVANVLPFAHEVIEQAPVFSPDGSSIAFSGAGIGGVGYATYVMNADGSDVRRITKASPSASLPDWAPDGSLLSVSHCCDSHEGRLWTVRPDGTGRTEIFAGGQVFESSFAPEGDRIAFEHSSKDFSHDGIWVASADGTDATFIQDDAFEPVWGPEAGR